MAFRCIINYNENIFQVVRDPITGEITGLEEVSIPVEDDEDSLSMSRAPLPPSLATRGTTTQSPFLPAGFEVELEKMLEEATKGNVDIDLDNEEPGKFLGEGKSPDLNLVNTFCLEKNIKSN